jgi:uncharacterized GH25 family protein
MLKRLIVASLLSCTEVNAHEFWVEPLDYTIASTQSIKAEVRSGEYFEGEYFPYMPERIVRAELVGEGSRRPFSGQRGDIPALEHEANSGLQIIGYQSTSSVHTHQDFAEFRRFLDEDGLHWVEAAHKQRKLPAGGFRERFTRYAKSLISVDEAAGHDRAIGLPYELLVLSPLYGVANTRSIELQLWVKGQPTSGTQVTVFQKYEGVQQDRNPRKLVTDDEGKVSFPVGDGGEFLVSAVVMELGSDVPWHSHWTSITFSTK